MIWGYSSEARQAILNNAFLVNSAYGRLYEAPEERAVIYSVLRPAEPSFIEFQFELNEFRQLAQTCVLTQS